MIEQVLGIEISTEGEHLPNGLQLILEFSDDKGQITNAGDNLLGLISHLFISNRKKRYY